MRNRGQGEEQTTKPVQAPVSGPPPTSDSSAPASPTPTLPKGGGAIRGIGETFSANPVTGTGALSVPIAVSPGRAGFHPDLSLSYDSGAGNGPFGHGFHLSVPQVARKTEKGLPRYDDARDSDVFVLSGAEDLVPLRRESLDFAREIIDGGTELVERYRPRVEGLFARIEQRRNKETGIVHWVAVTKDNLTSVYGRSAEARIADPADPRRIFRWLLEETRDDRGNVITYHYKAEDLVGVSPALSYEAHRCKGSAPIENRYLKRIRYGNTTPGDPDPAGMLFELVFDYGEHDLTRPIVDEETPWAKREDAFSTYRAGFELRTYRLCRRVLTFHHFAELGASACLVRSTDFTYTEGPVLTQLTQVTHAGYLRDLETGDYQKKSTPPVDFGYSPSVLETQVTVVDRASTRDLPGGVQGSSYQWLDLDGDGLPGVLCQHGESLYYKQNLGGGALRPAHLLRERPTLAQGEQGGVHFADLDGDGRKELALFAPPLAGYQERSESGGFGPFHPFASPALLDWNDPNLRFIDLSGDGHEDILLAQGDHFLWYPSLAKGGFASPVRLNQTRDEEKGPALVFADGTQTIFLADMSGDGLTDLVRIRNGQVCYWPNLGYGRFGAKVVMGGANHFDNPDQFDPRRIRLADIDGSGTTDILYIHRDGVRIHENRSGNSLGPAIALPRFPDMSDFSSVAAVDLLGTGTACLVWSTSLPGGGRSPLRYVDLLGSKKPHLLVSVKNNLGLETRVEYAPSTRFSLEDAAAGRPWVTRLPFPVQVLSRVESYDAVSRHRFVSLYKYHHGHYDGVEREFRGFAMVEQWDTESFARASGAGLFPAGENQLDPEFHQPPVYTKTWFHTGAWQGREKISLHLATEYYHGDSLATLLPDTLLPEGLSTTEAREACRALRGQILRQEVYAQDGSAAEPHPYTVSERSYDVRLLQPAVKGASETDPRSLAKAAHGVFFVHPREAIEYHYERNPHDPRVTHAFTLVVDAFGTVTRAAAVAYPRRSASGLPAEQTSGAITLTEQAVFHAADEADWYRLGVPIEARSYALTGLAPSGSAFLSFAAVVAAAESAEEISYEMVPDSSVQKRLLSQARHFYTKNDLSGPLALGEVESLALPHTTYTLAFTPALLASALGGRATDAILEEGGYVRFSPEEDWWVPSGRQTFSASAFYLPVSFQDPFGNSTSVTYDAYHLFVTQVTDPLGNVVQALHDYRVLSPALLTDANGNRGAAAFDELGMVIATAVMGKVGESDGDTLDDPTTTFAYDLERYRTTGQPNVVHARARERHGDAGTRWQETYSYSDGSGHEVMRKVQAEPGDAPARDESGALLHDEDGALVFAAADPRWVGTGRTVLDNKGHPVKQYEPFFSATHEYESETELVAWGVTPILRYDAVGRLVRTDLPNGTYSKVVFTPWKQTSFDPNDTVLDSLWYTSRHELDLDDPERRAAELASAHDGTPSTAHLDALGRTFLTEADNGTAGVYATRLTLDIEGNPLVVTDARDNEAMRHVFGMGGRKLYQKSCDAGARWMLADVAGQPLRAWDERTFTRRAAYDALRRGTHHFVQKAGADELLAERVVYGEGHSDAATLNLRGKVYRQYDGAGVVTSGAYDFKGNLLAGERRVAVAYATQVAWSALVGLTSLGDMEDAAEALLEAEVFATQTAYDALNRPVSMTTPDGSELRPTYNEASLLEKVDVRIRGAAGWTSFIDDIDYDAKGQRERIEYGNGTATTYSYDPLTFRLARLRTVRASDGAVLQNLAYTYDPVGNIAAIADSAQQTVFFNNAVVTPSTQYVYDALYRLIEASGREHAGGVGDDQRDENDVPLMNLPHANDSAALRNYTELYGYDAVGNLLSMVHQAGMAGSWTRRYEVAGDSNRLLSTSLPGDGATGPYSAEYGYDAHGNMTSMPHLIGVGWDHKDQMMLSDLGGGGVVYYTHDAAGQRVRKVWEHSGLVEERIYLGGYEVYRKRDVSGLLVERQSLHVMDGAKRVCLVETKTVDTAEGGSFEVSTVLRFQLGNHLGSAALEVDGEGAVISWSTIPTGRRRTARGRGRRR